MTTPTDRLKAFLAETDPKPTEPAPPTFDPDLIPDLGPSTRSPEDEAIDALLDGIDILEAYRKWCGKSEPKVGKKRESVMVSCPIPGHADKNPSAWLNLDKDVFFCGACQQGGDALTIAGYKFGLDPHSKDFPKLRRAMAEDLGFVVRKTTGGQTYVEEPFQESARSGDTETPSKNGTVLPSKSSEPTPQLEVAVTAEPETTTEDDDWDSEYQAFVEATTIDWRTVLPEDTFLRRWMETVCVDDLPDEYYFWLGLIAVGLAAGNDAVLKDNPRVKGNLFVCLFGPTGIGKSRAIYTLTRLLRLALPYDHASASKGAMMAPIPGSAEALVDVFSKPIMDPTDPHKIVGYDGVRGLVRFDELSSLTERAGRLGSTLKPTLMELFDGYETIELRSRTAGYVRAENHFCSTIATTQPQAVRKLVNQGDVVSGFLNRWVFASGRTKELVAYGRTNIDLDSLADPLRDLRAWAGSGRLVDLDKKALAHWREFFSDFIEPHRISEEHPLLTRMDLTLKKLMLLLAIDMKVDTVDEELMTRVTSLMNYLRRTYSLLDQGLKMGDTHTPFSECAEAVEQIVRRLPGSTLRDIKRYLPKKFTHDLAIRVVKALVETGELNEELIAGKRGPKTVRYTYVE